MKTISKLLLFLFAVLLFILLVKEFLNYVYQPFYAIESLKLS